MIRAHEIEPFKGMVEVTVKEVHKALDLYYKARHAYLDARDKRYEELKAEIVVERHWFIFTKEITRYDWIDSHVRKCFMDDGYASFGVAMKKLGFDDNSYLEKRDTILGFKEEMTQLKHLTRYNGGNEPFAPVKRVYITPKQSRFIHTIQSVYEWCKMGK